MLVETIKGRKFYGYTNIGFDSSDSTKSDNNAFLISFDKLKTYDYIRNSYAAISSFGRTRNSLPTFYSHNNRYHNIDIVDNFFSNDGGTAKKGDCYYTSEDYELNFGEECFRVKELEYFQIIFD